MHDYGWEYEGIRRQRKAKVGDRVKVVKDTSTASPLADNGWKIGDVGIIQMVLNDHPEYNIIVQRGDDRHDTLGFSIEELELLNA